MTAVDLAVVAGDSLTFEVTFTRDGAPWADVEDFDPVCQFRPRPSSATTSAVPVVSFADEVATFALTDEQTAAMAATSSSHVWDVQFTDPTAPEGLGVFTWPGAGQPRHTLAITGDVARVEGS